MRSSGARYLGMGVRIAALVAMAYACGGRSDDTQYACLPLETVCNGECSSVVSDPANCGSCGNACGPGTVCYDGDCTTSCGGGTVQCGQSCVDTDVDRNHCGACNVHCGAGEACVAGACSSTCADGQTLCTLGGGAAYCADTLSDNKNCGTCSNACGPQLACNNGVCSSTCTTGQTFCASVDAGVYCVDTNSDNANCGSCGNTCGGGTSCIGGLCAVACGAVDGGAETLCTPDAGAPYCANTSSDNDNCGACGAVCAPYQKCIAGACISVCPLGFVECNGTCVNPKSDDNHCGATDGCGGDAGTAGSVCGLGESCVSGTCRTLTSDRVIFVSSVQFGANLGGVSGADAKCAALAITVGLPGTYKAWLSDDTTTASSRLAHSSHPYILTDFTTVVANDWAGLTSGTLLHAINRTELGTAPPTTTYCPGPSSPTVYTDTTTDGVEWYVGYACKSDWSGVGSDVAWGNANRVDAAWTSWCRGFTSADCDGTQVASIYCVEQ